MSDQSKGYDEDVLFAVSDPQIGAKKPLTGAEQEALEDAAARNIAKPTVTIGDKTLPVESVTIDFKQETPSSSFVMPQHWYELPNGIECGDVGSATNIPNVQMTPGPYSVEIRNEWGPAWQNAEIPDDVTHDGNGSLAPIMLSGKRVTVYLAGPMASLPGFGFDRFDAARDNLIINGYKVISPADIDREIGFDPSVGAIDDFDLPAAIRRDVDAILGCDAVVLLPGHETSKGAIAERYVAKWAGIPCYTYPELLPYREKRIAYTPLLFPFEKMDGDSKPLTDDEAGSMIVPEELTQATLDYDETFPIQPPAKESARYKRVDSEHSSPKDGDTITNERGGKQSFLSADFSCIPPECLRLLAQCLGFGKNKYGRDNWKDIDQEDNIAHAMNHLNEYRMGDRSEPHLVNAMARVTFALSQAVANGTQSNVYVHPDQK